MEKEKAYKIKDQLDSFYSNVRAEVIANELIEDGISPDDLEIDNQGGFFRPFRKDVSSTKVFDYNAGDYLVSLRLSRYGIYDILPEGLLHKQDSTSEKNKSATTSSAVYKNRKKEENGARKFFKPIENEIFNQLIQLEDTEKKLLCNQRARFFSFLVDFWKIDRTLKSEHQMAILQVIQYSHLIAGNFDLIRTCLEYFLEAKANYKISYTKIRREANTAKLGYTRLGKNTIIGITSGHVPKVTFTIGPVKSDNITDYIGNGSCNRFVNEFFSYVIPLEYNWEIKWLADDGPKEKKTNIGHLGYTLKI
ncbi:MAG: hypothetical protein MI922_16800 [Bacteroidales bacterium]|nr:hypothetical protein [Bacteroidales bacterium]